MEIIDLSLERLNDLFDKIQKFILGKKGWLIDELYKFIHDTLHNSLELENENLSFDHQFEEEKERLLRSIKALCDSFNIGIECDEESFFLHTGYNRKDISAVYHLITWDTKIKDLKTLQLFKGQWGSIGFDAEDIEGNLNISATYEEFGGFWKIYNYINQGDKEIIYQFERIRLPRHYAVLKTEPEFFIGKDVTNNFFGNLALAFRVQNLGKVQQNLEYIKLLLTKDELKENYKLNIATFEELFYFIKAHQSKKRTFKVPLENNHKIAFQQFLNFFPEFVEKAKGQKIKFEVINQEKELVIEVTANDEIDVEEIIQYLEEYFALLKQEGERLSINSNQELSENEINMLVLKLENEIAHLKNSLKIAALENKVLEGDKKTLEVENKFLNHVLEQYKNSQLPPAKLSNEDFKEKMLDALGKNKIDYCIDQLKEHLKENPDKHASKKLIGISAKFNDCEDASIDFETRSRMKAEIVQELVKLVEGIE